jgi:hypothetical protein
MMKLACGLIDVDSAQSMKTLKYSAVLFILVSGILALAVGIVLLPPSEPEIVRVFKQKYKQIDNGMTKEEVESILGKPRESNIATSWQASRESPVQNVIMAIWIQESPEGNGHVGGHTITVYFKDGLVVGKEFSGLSA